MRNGERGVSLMLTKNVFYITSRKAEVPGFPTDWIRYNLDDVANCGIVIIDESSCPTGADYSRLLGNRAVFVISARHDAAKKWFDLGVLDVLHHPLNVDMIKAKLGALSEFKNRMKKPIGKKILYIEDEPVFLEMFAECFENPFQVSLLRKPERVRTVLEEQNPDIVVTDLVFQGTTGFDITKTVREWNESIPVVIASKQRQPVLMQKAFESGALCFITKPFSDISRAALLNTVGYLNADV